MKPLFPSLSKRIYSCLRQFAICQKNVKESSRSPLNARCSGILMNVGGGEGGGGASQYLIYRKHLEKRLETALVKTYLGLRYFKFEQNL